MIANSPITLGLVDDHKLFRKGLISLIEFAYGNARIIFEADDGQDLQHQLTQHEPPDMIIMDVNMPRMDGFASVQWLNEHFPLIKVLVISMVDKEESVVQMLKLGVKGYLSKDVEPRELGEALIAIHNKGYYFTDFITGKLVHSILYSSDSQAELPHDRIRLNDRERNFLQLACSEKTYSEIAREMFLSPKTIDGYRNVLFERLGVRSRVGLVIYAIKHGVVKI